MIERTPLLLDEEKKLAFKGGILNRHRPGPDSWLPDWLRPRHNAAPRKEAPEPKPRRPGDPLRDEPLRIGLSAKVRRLFRNLRKKRSKRHGHLVADTTLDLMRSELLLDHDKPT